MEGPPSSPREGVGRLSHRRYSCAWLPPVGSENTSGEASTNLSGAVSSSTRGDRTRKPRIIHRPWVSLWQQSSKESTRCVFLKIARMEIVFTCSSEGANPAFRVNRKSSRRVFCVSTHTGKACAGSAIFVLAHI